MSKVNHVVATLSPKVAAWRRYATVFVGAALLNLASAVWLAETSPYVMEVQIDFGEEEITYGELIQQLLENWLQSNPVSARECHTEWYRSANEPLICTISAKNIDSWFGAWEKLMNELQSASLQPRSWTLTHRPSLSESPLWSILVLAIVYLSLSFWLIRGRSPAADLHSALRAVWKKPWLLVVPLLVWLLVANASMFILTTVLGEASVHPFGMYEIPGDEAFAQIMEAALGYMATPWFMVYMVILAPLFEESLFRGWLYEKTKDNLPVWANTLVNAWFFMLLHVVVLALGFLMGFWMNPVQASPLLIPVSFALGVAFFLVRVRFNSVSLCILLHALHNATMLAGIGYLLTTWNEWPV